MSTVLINEDRFHPYKTTPKQKGQMGRLLAQGSFPQLSVTLYSRLPHSGNTYTWYPVSPADTLLIRPRPDIGLLCSKNIAYTCTVMPGYYKDVKSAAHGLNNNLVLAYGLFRFTRDVISSGLVSD